MSIQSLISMELNRRRDKMVSKNRQTKKSFSFAENGYFLRRGNNFESNVHRLDMRNIEIERSTAYRKLRHDRETAEHLLRHLERPVTEHLDRYNPASRLRHEYQQKRHQNKQKHVIISRDLDPQSSTDSMDKKSKKAKITLAVYKNTNF